jgi:gluconokinase
MASLIIDVGSSSVRALLVDEELNLIPDAVAQLSYQFEYQPEGASMVSAVMLRDLVERCIDQVLAHPRADSIKNVGMATFVGNLLGVDDDNIPLTPIYTYADVRSMDDVQALKQIIDQTASHQRTGCLLHTAYHPARLRWLKRSQPDLYRSVSRWQDLGTYLYRSWFGREVPASYSVSSWSGLLNRQHLNWDAEWLQLLELEPSALPSLAEFSTVQTGLSPEYKMRWKPLSDVPFYLSVGDGSAANIGSGGVGRDKPVLTIGTTAAVRIITDEVMPVVPQGLWSYRTDTHHHLIGGATSEGGNIFEWARRTLAVNPSQIEAHLQNATPAGHGLTFLPLLAGERSPGWNAHATGTIHGIHLSTSPLDILQASLEGVALRLSVIMGQLVQGESQAEVFGSGGALAHSPMWAQIIANAFNRPINLLQDSQVTAQGVAILINRWGDTLPPPIITQVYHPQPQAVALMKQALDRQQDLYTRLYGTSA